MAYKKNILFIGETGVGKSSLINLILGHGEAVVSDSTDRGTLDFNVHEFNDYQLIDTIGFNDTEQKQQMESLKNLAKFMVRPDIKDGGISLIVYVMKAGRVKSPCTDNYKFFKKTFCGGEVKVMLVVTSCELYEPMDSWYEKEQANFKKFGMQFDGAVCGCTSDVESITNSIMQQLHVSKRSETKANVLAMINDLALRVPWKPKSWIEWFGDVLKGLAAFGISTTYIILFLLGPAEFIIGACIGVAASTALAYLVEKFRNLLKK